MKKCLWCALCFAVMLVCASCASKVQPLDNSVYPVPTPCENFEEAVKSAALQRRWGVTKLDDGTIRLTLLQRAHKVVVDVVYIDETFSINYVDSSNMLYDAKAGVIHRNYNKWVRNLAKEILKFASGGSGSDLFRPF